MVERLVLFDLTTSTIYTIRVKAKYVLKGDNYVL